MSRPVALSLPAAEPSARSSASVVGSSGPTIVMLQPVEHAHLQRDPAVRVAMVRRKMRRRELRAVDRLHRRRKFVPAGRESIVRCHDQQRPFGKTRGAIREPPPT
jgi:hypothetical protein